MMRSSSRSMRRFTQQRASRGFGWEKLVNPWTPVATVERFKLVDTKIMNQTKYANSISLTVPEIDWEYWRSSISAPGVVDALQKEYEGHAFKDVDVNVDVAGAAEVEQEVFDSQVSARIAEVELECADEQIAHQKQVKEECWEWNTSQWLAEDPDQLDMIIQRWRDEEYLDTPEDIAVLARDYPQLIRDVREGKLDTDPTQHILDRHPQNIERAEHLAAGTYTLKSWNLSAADRKICLAERAALVEKIKAELKEA